MNYCSRCGSEVELRIPEGDNRPRHCCPDCGTIHYQNPRIIAGCVPEWEDRILLCRRAIKPRHGYWTLPAGYMENGESVEEAARRETWEEARARVEIGPLLAMYSVPHIAQVYTLFRAALRDLNFEPGSESLEVRLFKEDEIPWNELAFPVIEVTLRGYFKDRQQVQIGTLEPMRTRR
ncbi:MAG: NUDIX hydrolase [Gammaproteobacteria bacterium]|nr:NUDIX hydrolase [Gammaproteobacteria bacterium]MCP5135781.1 NUDIX hydrolase [Gammaproteobacteria bacterium]